MIANAAQHGGRVREEVLVPIHSDSDVVAARVAVRRIAASIGFGRTDLTLLATAVSELARNILRYGAGDILIKEILEHAAPPGLMIVARDPGGRGSPGGSPGPKGQHSPKGLQGVRTLMDEFEVKHTAGGNTIVAKKWLGRAPAPIGS